MKAPMLTPPKYFCGVIARSPTRCWRRSNPWILAIAGCLAAAAGSSLAADPPRLIKAHFTPKDQQVERYVNVPFDVPAGTTRIDIELKYDRARGENVVDLGLLEPGSLDLGTKAFRGWTGGERSSIFVSAVDATPGYWPGPIQAGRWSVGLGLYKVGAAGVDVEVTVKTSSDPMTAVMPGLAARPKEPIRTGPAWYAGALHAHTHNSDGALSAQALAEKARVEGLDFLAITDHNNTAHQRERIEVPGLLTIVGEEVTTPGGHANVWGLGGVRDFVDFRVSPGDPAIRSLFNTAVARGAVVGINHPYSECVACSWTHPVPDAVRTIEITGREPAEILRAIALWDIMLVAGRRVTAIGVSDWHRGD
ncbi:MAG: CehA/McbA family metallohydrolase, partial [Vicinamibacteria bacterium]